MPDNTPDVTPVFLFSLPRSGSTLLQRMLGSHSEVSTVAEPWLLLGQLYLQRNYGLMAEYGHAPMYRALHDFCSELPDGIHSYNKHLQEFIHGLYREASPSGTRYFLDKTPRYSFIAKEITSLFPNAKFIFLWRNPMAVAASIQSLWGVEAFHKDLHDGLENLVQAAKHLGSKGLTIQYEQLLEHPKETLHCVMQYLELENDRDCLQAFNEVELKGRMGDPTGRFTYKNLSNDPIDKWERRLNNPVMARWARRYLAWVGKDRMAYLGYDYDQTRNQVISLSRLQLKTAIQDIILNTRQYAGRRFRTCLYKRNASRPTDI